MNELLDKLKNFEEKYNKLIEKLSSPEVTSNPEKIKEFGKKVSEIEEIVNLAKQYRSVITSLDEAGEMLDLEKDDEMKEYLKDEINKNNETKAVLERQIKIQLTPKDPNDKKSVIVEVRAGT